MKIINKNFFVLLLLLLIGLVLGGVIGELFRDTLNILSYGKSIGFSTFTVDLSIIELTLGLKMHINFAGVLGILIAFLIFKKIS